MESRYGIGINNRYALFLDREGELDDCLLDTAPKKPTNDLVEKKNNRGKAVVSEVPVPDVKSASKEDKENQANESTTAQKQRQPVSRRDGPSVATNEERNNRRNVSTDVPSIPSNDGASRDRGGRGGGRGSRGGPRSTRGEGRGGFSRGGGNGNNYNRNAGKREFERKSGDDKTGVKSVDKRDGSGAYNWGTAEDEINGINDEANVSAEETVTVLEGSTETAGRTSGDEGVVLETGRGAESDEVAEEEAVERTMTLDEWKLLQADKKSGPVFNVRKAGEGSDIDPKWKKTYAYKKEKELIDDEEEEEHTIYPQRANRQKRVTDIKFSFSDSPGSRGGRGGRGGRGSRGGGFDMNRGGRPTGGEGFEDGGRFPAGNGEERGNRGGGPRRGGGGERPFRSGANRGSGKNGEKNQAPNVNDELSFPSLG